ncbi:MAG: leucine-rich repeat protein, partial [Christensenellales bacterium]
SKNKKLEKVDFSNCQNLRNIEYEAFSECENLKEVNFTNCKSLVGLQEASFRKCPKLEKVTFTNCEKLINIGSACFEICVHLKSIDLSNLPEMEIIESYAFGHTGLENVIFPNNDKFRKIEERAFSYCNDLTEVNLKNSSIEILGHSAFTGCAKLKVMDVSNCKNLREFNQSFYLHLDKIDLRNTNNLEKFKAYLPMETERVLISDELFGVGESCTFRESFEPTTNIEVYNNDKLSFEFKIDDKIYKDYRVLSLGLLKYARSKGYDLNSDFLNVFRGKNELNVALKDLSAVNNLIRMMIKDCQDAKIKESVKLLRVLGYFGFNNNDKAELEVYKNVLAKDLIKHKIKVDIKGETNRDYINQLLQEKTNKIARSYSLEKLVGEFVKNNIVNNEHKENLIDYVEFMKDSADINIKFAEFFVSNFDEIMNRKIANANPKEFNVDFDNSNGGAISIPVIYNDFDKILSKSNKKIITRQKNQRFTLDDCEYGNSYKNVIEGNEELAKLCGQSHLSQMDFEMLQRCFEDGKKMKDKQILTATSDTSNSEFTYSIIEKDNPLGLVLGNITNCCQRIGHAGESCVYVGELFPYSCFATINYKGQIIGQAWVWCDEKSKTIALDNIEVPDVYYKLVNKEKNDEVRACIDRLCDSLYNTMKAKGFDFQNVIIGCANTDIGGLGENYYLEKDENKLIHCKIEINKKPCYSDIDKSGQYYAYKDGKKIQKSKDKDKGYEKYLSE